MRGLQNTAELLKGRDLQKYYHAIAAGRIDCEQLLKGFLVKDETTNTVRITKECDPDSGKSEKADYIETAYRPLEYFGDATLIEVHLITGRPHQIRAHLASCGHPILGDPKYGDAELNRSLQSAVGLAGQLLCACRMEFPDGLVVEIPDPESFAKAGEWCVSVSQPT